MKQRHVGCMCRLSYECMKKFLLKQNKANLVKCMHPAKDLPETNVFQTHRSLKLSGKASQRHDSGVSHL